jgi:RimJ/RimL family protein N-acetyltransferase
MHDRSPPASVPRLRTGRLTLREYRPADFDAFAGHLADPVAMAILGTRDRRDAWRMFGCNAGGWLLHGAGWWAIELTDSGTLVGTIGAFFRETGPDIEIGWNTFRAYWGRGIATEAATEVVRHVFEDRRDQRAIALIDASNTASLRVAAHVRMAYEADTELFGAKVGRFVRLRDST